MGKFKGTSEIGDHKCLKQFFSAGGSVQKPPAGYETGEKMILRPDMQDLILEPSGHLFSRL